MKCIGFIFLLLLLLLPGLYGQNIPLIRFSEEDGLAGNSVQDVLRDKNDFLWIATETGLSKYDGTFFKNFEKSDGLPNNMVRALSCGDGNQVYAGCYNGGLAEIEDDRVRKIYYTNGRFPNSIRKLHYSRAYQTLFAGTDYGIYVLKDSSMIRLPVISDSTIKQSVLSITEYGKRIFFAIHGPDKFGLYELFYDPLNPLNSKTSLISQKGKFSLLIKNDTLYSSEYNRIYANPVKDIKNRTVYAEIDSQFLIWNMLTYDNGILACGFDDGRFSGNLAFIDRNTKTVKDIPFKIDASSVVASFMDSVSNILWLGTDNGLYSIFQTPVKYSDFRNIKDLAFYRDTLFILTDEAVFYALDNKYYKLKDKNEVRRIAGKNGYFLTDVHKSFGLNNFFIDNEILYLQTSEGAVSVPSFSKYLPFGTGIFKSNGERSVYAQTGYNVLRYYEDIGNLGKFDTVSVGGSPVRNILEIIGSDSILYLISAQEGLIVIKDHTATRYSESNSPIENILSDIDKSEDGHVWLSSAQGNLYEVAYSGSLIIKRILNQGKGNFRGTKIKWIKAAGGWMYIATDKGINLISASSLNSPEPESDYFFNANNGYPFINAVSPVAGKNGRVYVHDSERLIGIDPVMPVKTDNDFYFPEVRINNEAVGIVDINYKSLPSSTKQIQVVFSQKKYPSGRNLLYRYKVNGSQWLPGNMLTLQSLKPGKYRVEIEAEDPGFNSVTTGEISFAIFEPLVRKWWFMVLSAGLFIMLTSILFLRRIKVMRREHREKTQLITNNSELKLRSLQIQMNPHFIFNALNSIQYCILTGSTDDSLHYLSNLAKIIRTNLENANEEYISLSDELDFLERYISIEKVRFRDNLEIKINNRVGDESLAVPPMLIQPILENAIRHGMKESDGTGIVSIDLFLEGETLKIVVADNGKGRSESRDKKTEKNKSLGLSTIRKRLELLNIKYKTSVHGMIITDLFIDNVPSGTKVELNLLAVRRHAGQELKQSV